MSKPTHLLQASTNHYQAYLVRFWRTGDADNWLALTRNIQTGEVQLFASIEQCVAFLQLADSAENRSADK